MIDKAFACRAANAHPLLAQLATIFRTVLPTSQAGRSQRASSPREYAQVDCIFGTLVRARQGEDESRPPQGIARLFTLHMKVVSKIFT
jgi:hypothetical protein